jgi:hypothetical protein
MKKKLSNDVYCSPLKHKCEAQQLGRIDKGEKCSVSGCGREAARSVSLDKARAAGLNVSEDKRAYLCKEHYKEFKKKTRKDKTLEKWRYG